MATAQVLVVGVDDTVVANKIVRFARAKRPDIHILALARARDRIAVCELYQSGANDIVRETFDLSLYARRNILENMGISEHEASSLSKTRFRMDRSATPALAELWVPGQRVDLNPAYIDRAKQLDLDM